MKYHRIPDETIRRMPKYLRALGWLQQQGYATISSQQLAGQLHLKSPQIRKDLSYFGAFGTRGIGYPVEKTASQIRQILKLDSPQKAVLVGAGRLGTALAEYRGFEMLGFEIAAIFDKSPEKIGKRVGALVIEDARFLHRIQDRQIRLAILAVPAEAAQECADVLVDAGIKGILNLSPLAIDVPRSVKVISIDLAVELGVLPYYV